MKKTFAIFISLIVFCSCGNQTANTSASTEQQETMHKFVYPIGKDTLSIAEIQRKDEWVGIIRCNRKLEKDILLKFIFEENKQEFGVYKFWIDGESEDYAEYRNFDETKGLLYMYSTGFTYSIQYDSLGNYKIIDKRQYGNK